MKKHLSLRLISCFLFLVLLGLGFRLAQNKPFWNDEIYSQVYSINDLSYLDIFQGKIPEGNALPLFYFLQKVISDVAGVKTSDQWIPGGDYLWEPYSQIILRINPVLFMSLSVVIIFYYFSRFHSFLAGFYSLAISMSSYMLWLYWAEARHYSQWFFLTTLQSLLFLFIVRQKEFHAKAWKALIITHVLLSLTVVLGMIQIFFVSTLLWVLKEKRWQKYLLLTALPICICIVYYIGSPKYPYHFTCSVMQLIYPCIPKQWMFIFAIYTLILLFYFFQKRTKSTKIFNYNVEWAGRSYLILTALMFVMAFAFLGYLKLQEPPGQKGFEIPMRFFIFLTPVGIIAATLFSIDIVRVFKGNRWMLTNVVIGLLGLLVIGFLRNCFWVIGLY